MPPAREVAAASKEARPQSRVAPRGIVLQTRRIAKLHRLAQSLRSTRAVRVAELHRVEKLERRKARLAARILLASKKMKRARLAMFAKTRRSVPVRFAMTEPVRRRHILALPPTRPEPSAKRPEWTTDGELDAAVASLGPSARAGQRMWVRVVAAHEVHIKPALAVGGLAGRADVGALNCWGQPVMFVGRGGNRWSREMVCDDKPAGANEWSAQIYYGGRETK